MKFKRDLKSVNMKNMNMKNVNMKKLFRRNQIIVTTLAVMIAAAGYLNYTGKKDLEAGNVISEAGMMDISDEDILMENQGILDTPGKYEEILSLDQDLDQIEEAEKKAREYEAEIKKAEENLEYLRKKLAAEIALSQAAANGKWRDISEISFAEGDRKLLANLIYCEAGGEPYAGKVAVGSVVINRVLSSKFPDTVIGVIYQSRQFSPVASGRLELALTANKATPSCYQAADEAMSGVTNVGTCVFFRTPVEGLSGINIGGHIFY